MEKVSEGVEPVFGCKSKEIDMGLFPFGWSAAISASSSHESKRLPLQHRELDLNYDMAAVAQAQIARRNVTECLDLLPSSRPNEESCFSPQMRFQNPATERPQAQLREQNFLQPDLNRSNLDATRASGASGADNGPLFNVLEKEQIMELLRSSLAQEICETTNFGSNLHEHLFYKVVTPSDVGKLNRLVIPKQHAERFFPLDPSLRKKGRLLSFQDSVTGELWWFRYSYWSSSQSYVLTKGWIRFVKDKNLRAGDIISFERGSQHELYINCRRRPTRGIIISDEEQDLPGMPPHSNLHHQPSISHSNLHSNLHHPHSHVQAHAQASAAAARPAHLQSFLHNIYPSASAHILASSDLSSSTSLSHTRIDDHILDPDFSPPTHRLRPPVSNSDTRLFGVDLSAPKPLS